MTRKWRRELERALEGLGVPDPDVSYDAREGVTAEFVTYEEEPPEILEGWAETTRETESGAVIHVLEPAAHGEDGGGGS